MTDKPDVIEAQVEANRANVETTLNALKEKMSLEGVVRNVGTYVGMSDPRQSVDTLGRAVNANPVAFGLIAAGIACLATGATRRTPQYGVSAPYDSMNGSSVGQTHIRPAAPHSGEDSAGYVQRAKDALQGGYDAAGEALGHAGHSAQERYQGVRNQAGDLTHQAGHHITQQPLLFGALALLAGAALGAALPKSNAERTYLGPVHDQLAHGVRETASDLAHRASDAAAAGVNAALDVADDEGLTPKSDTTIAERVQHVAEAAVDTTVNEFKKDDRA